MKKFLLTTALTAMAAFGSSAAQAEQLKVAIIESFSGPTAQTAIPFVEGMRYGFSKLNAQGGFNGEPIAVVEYDALNQPAAASEKLKSAIAEGARIVFTSTNSAVAAQLSEDIRKYNLRNKGKEILLMMAGSEAFELVAEKCNFWAFKTASNPFIRIKALVAAMKDTGKLGSKVYSINQNYSYGVDHERAQAASVAAAGSKIVGSTLHDVSKIQDFSPYIASIKASGADTVLSGNWGNDIILFMRALGDSGIKVNVGNTSLDTTGAVSAMGEAALGALLVKLYNLEAGGEAGKAFAEDFKSAIGHYPYNEEPTGVFSTLLLGAALKAVSKPNAKVDTLQIALALEDASYETPAGSWSIRKDDHQVILPVTVSEISKDARYKVDGTDMGFKLLKIVSPEDSAVPADPKCKMQRP
ncbi:ABC transporter substrate-binding protein [Microvirga puerhi]|uniref:ABC transporter substrate-binding protein n=1 Tax=Microvirga puerhi TaxID=2876078 RepID=A0ABS7VT48_9HYPH|nr:ABC transporter substrate-binding protein [Microvirga puerhi]MBZ6078725.1 ABC transporter substrate-binding protein [Microvirga puerhi]